MNIKIINSVNADTFYIEVEIKFVIFLDIFTVINTRLSGKDQNNPIFSD